MNLPPWWPWIVSPAAIVAGLYLTFRAIDAIDRLIERWRKSP